jgi:adenylate kinase
MRIVFIAGIHGVGKGSTCSKIVDDEIFFHRSASSIIKAEKASAISANSKRVVDVADNQRLLLAGISRFRASKGTLLLDGHFTLISKDGTLVEIPMDVFTSLELSQIVMIVDDPVEISKRLESRDGCKVDVDFIREHQFREERHGRSVAALLGVPFSLVGAFDSENLLNSCQALGS